jgi:hypothetical protein
MNDIVAYVNSIVGPGTIYNYEESVGHLLASHRRLREQNAERHQWFRGAPYWRRLLFTWSGYPWRCTRES